nr:unnamed protein product [Spirometra erinaceieuropaei]
MTPKAPRKAPSDQMRHRSASPPTLASVANFASNATPVTGDHTVAAPPPSSADTIRPASTPASTAAFRIITTSFLRTPPTDTTTSDDPSTSNITEIPTFSDVHSVHACPHCNRTSTSYIGLVERSRNHCTEAGEPVSGAPTYTRRIRLNCPHCTRTFIHRVGL